MSLSFRSKLLLAMMTVVIGVSGATLYLTTRRVRAVYQGFFQQQFERETQHLTELQAARLGTITNRCLELTNSVRIQSAVGESDPEVLYNYELVGAEFRGILEQGTAPTRAPAAGFYCFLEPDTGELLVPPKPDQAQSSAAERSQAVTGFTWAQLNRRLARLRPVVSRPEQQQIGYLGLEDDRGQPQLFEFITTRTFDGGAPRGALVLGFPVKPGPARPDDPARLSKSGILLESQLYSTSISRADRAQVAAALTELTGRFSSAPEGARLNIDGTPHRIFYRALNSGVIFPRAYQVNLYSLAPLLAAQRNLFWMIVSLGLIASAGAFFLSLFLAHGLSGPVRDLVSGTAEIERGNFQVQVPVRSRDELGHLAGSFNRMAVGLAEREKFRSVLNKVSDKKVADQLMKQDAVLGGEHREISVLFCDIRGFTALTQNMPPGEVIQMLNEHFTPLTRVVNDHDGMVDKFVGDLIMAVFGAPFSHDDDARQAVRCALTMIAEREKLNTVSQHRIRMGIGIASGPAVAGCMGSEDRLNYTVLGERVNLASRLCGQAGPMEVVIDQTTFEHLAGTITAEALPPVKLKGFSEPVKAYKVLAARDAPIPA